MASSAQDSKDKNTLRIEMILVLLAADFFSSASSHAR